jgi:hypothetical protein
MNKLENFRIGDPLADIKLVALTIGSTGIVERDWSETRNQYISDRVMWESVKRIGQKPDMPDIFQRLGRAALVLPRTGLEDALCFWDVVFSLEKFDWKNAGEAAAIIEKMKNDEERIRFWTVTVFKEFWK